MRHQSPVLVSPTGSGLQEVLRERWPTIPPTQLRDNLGGPRPWLWGQEPWWALEVASTSGVQSSVLLREGQVGAWLSDHECSGEGALGRLATVSGREGDGCELQQERLELDIRENCGT